MRNSLRGQYDFVGACNDRRSQTLNFAHEVHKDGRINRLGGRSTTRKHGVCRDGETVMLIENRDDPDQNNAGRQNEIRFSATVHNQKVARLMDNSRPHEYHLTY